MADVDKGRGLELVEVIAPFVVIDVVEESAVEETEDGNRDADESVELDIMELFGIVLVVDGVVEVETAGEELAVVGTDEALLGPTLLIVV